MNSAAARQGSGGGPRLRRRDLGLAAAGTALAVAVPAGLTGPPAAAAEAGGPAPAGHRRTVRLASVGALQTGGLLNQLLTAFQAESGFQVDLFIGQVDELYQRARAGLADLVTSHLGVAALEDAVGDRVGRWPQLVLSTMFTFVAAPADPAGIRTASDAVDAFDRIAQTQSPFVVNNLNSPLAITDVLWHAAGSPDQAGWFLDPGLAGPAAVREAERLGGYTLWGLHPFLAFRQQQPPTTMQPVLFGDPLMQRVVSSMVVRPSWERRVNLAGALALQEFLLAPATQGQIWRFRHPMIDQPIFWPAAHHNQQGE